MLIKIAAEGAFSYVNNELGLTLFSNNKNISIPSISLTIASSTINGAISVSTSSLTKSYTEEKYVSAGFANFQSSGTKHSDDNSISVQGRIVDDIIVMSATHASMYIESIPITTNVSGTGTVEIHGLIMAPGEQDSQGRTRFYGNPPNFAIRCSFSNGSLTKTEFYDKLWAPASGNAYFAIYSVEIV